MSRFIDKNVMFTAPPPQSQFTNNNPATSFQDPALGTGVFAPGNDVAPTDGYKIRTAYIWQNGTVLLPVAKLNAQGGPLAATISQLASPYGLKIVSWIARRTGDIPIMPDPEPDNDNQILGSFQLEFDDPEMTANQVPIITARGTYIYLLQKPISVKNGIFHMGGNPALTLDASQNVVTSDNFSADILSTGEGENPG
jgi:hypothetical protein